ncbi:hypothetical protein N657DRAFT_644043 [Parathielavia appendiculata]|uniref:BPL/LPL catalytic domain-containing protein n=1 Tax=Parathielavia appendiculata TaxID=2587402 RepID=A0AAN6U2Q8_9PEZI|nr:hypothetical protein N657DRAFT_644043 [Parathielavia appendiculata]
MAVPCRLRHLHLPSIHPHYIPYSLASRVQEHLRRQHLDFKDGSTTSRPPPTLLSFTPSPIYTLGRRQTAPLTPAEVARLTSPLRISTPPSQQQQSGATKQQQQDILLLPPHLVHSPRGGLTTYHGPGQVVLWPVLDLKSPHHRNFSVKCYARLLETTTIATLATFFHLEAFTTDDPGVWVRHHLSPASLSSRPRQNEDDANGEEEVFKIAALGVHLRRHITALGTAINIAMPGPGVADEGLNPWARIVACGLEGRGVTCVAAELGNGVGEVDELLLLRREKEARKPDGDAVVGLWRERAVAGAWAEELARRFGIEDGVEKVDEEEAVRLMESLVEERGAESGDAIEREYLAQMRNVFRGG